LFQQQELCCVVQTGFWLILNFLNDNLIGFYYNWHMKKTRIQYQYRWKIKCEGFKAAKAWGINAVEAFKDLYSVLKGIGYDDLTYFKIRNGRHLARLQKKHKYGKKTVIVYLIRLKSKRPVAG
jgi:hypothetical protein